MANCLGYEELSIGASALGPTASLVQGGVQCAVFYVDPDASGRVRYRPDATSPTGGKGIPLAPGKSIVVAGEGNIRNSLFIQDTTTSEPVKIHALYYDRVDVVDLGLSGNDAALSLLSQAVTKLGVRLDEMLFELRLIRTANELVVGESLQLVG